jgi:hypothetical protein
MASAQRPAPPLYVFLRGNGRVRDTLLFVAPTLSLHQLQRVVDSKLGLRCSLYRWNSLAQARGGTLQAVDEDKTLEELGLLGESVWVEESPESGKAASGTVDESPPAAPPSASTVLLPDSPVQRPGAVHFNGCCRGHCTC